MTGVAWLLRARLSLPLACLSCRVNVSPGRGIVSSTSRCYVEIIRNRPRGGTRMADEPITLKALLRQRHWTYATFCAEYEKTAKSIDPRLSRTWPSRAQFQRWLAGELRGLPYPDACRVLEAMFPGWTIEQLFARLPRADPMLSPGRLRANDGRAACRAGRRCLSWRLVIGSRTSAPCSPRGRSSSRTCRSHALRPRPEHPRMRPFAQPSVPAVLRAQPAAPRRGRHVDSVPVSGPRRRGDSAAGAGGELRARHAVGTHANQHPVAPGSRSQPAARGCSISARDRDLRRDDQVQHHPHRR